MKILQLLAATVCTALLGTSSFAQDAESVKAALKAKMPEAPVESVRKIPYGNLYEGTAGGEIFYTDDKVSFVLIGTLLDTKTKENVTDARMKQLNAVKFADLPFDSAIKIVRGNGSRKVAIFADPNCGYCKRFERDLLGISDVTVYTFLYPILSPDSLDKSKAIWCSSDKGKTWIDYMTKNTSIAGDGKCNTAAIDRTLAFGKEKNIRGTPTIIFEDGDRVPGAMPIAQFEKKLGGQKAASASAPVTTTKQ
jgi:thiol:disulfide interchange protein DsbC